MKVVLKARNERDGLREPVGRDTRQGVVARQPNVVIAPLPANLVQVPSAKQQRDFSCGAAATLDLLRYWCVDGFARADESSLYDALHTTPARGTEPEAIAEFLRAQGLEASYRNGDVSVADLERAVDAHQPPLVDLQAWSDHPAPWRETWDAGHYVVMVGYDADRLFFADPGNLTPGAYAFVERGEMEDRWHDLAGDDDVPIRRMAVFVRGARPWVPPEPPPAHATELR